MQLKTKVILLAVIPFAVTLFAIAMVVIDHQRLVAKRERALVEAATMEAKRTELRHYVELAISAIEPWYAAGRDDDASRQAALARLARLDYGRDGYFFLYDLDGRNLMHPRQPELVGHNLWDARDNGAQTTVQRLIAVARTGGGYLDYQWEKPSTGAIEHKLGYVVSLPRWNWMLGTGLYLEDVEATLTQLDQQNAANIEHLMLLLGGCALLGVTLIGGCGLALNLNQHRIANEKLSQLARQAVQSQEQERGRLSRELNDGSSQALVAIRRQIEAAAGQIDADPAAARRELDAVLPRIDAATRELRDIAHRLRPPLLDELGLPAALLQLAVEFSGDTAILAEVSLPDHARDLPEHVITVLFRVTQDALANVARHSGATRAWIALAQNEGDIALTVRDNGSGFSTGAARATTPGGVGLRTMRERLESIGGQFSVRTSSVGTEIEARVPRAAALPRAPEDGNATPGWMQRG